MTTARESPGALPEAGLQASTRVLLLAFVVLAIRFPRVSLLTLVALGGRQTLTALPTAGPQISLDPRVLPEYALRTTLRMFAAMAASLLVTFVFGYWAAKSRRAEMVIIPLIDVMQSVPVLAFQALTLAFFLGLFPGRTLGAGCLK